MEKDASGKITRFDVGDVAEIGGVAYGPLQPHETRPLNVALMMVRTGTTVEALDKGLLSIWRKDNKGYATMSYQEALSQLPVDLNSVRPELV